jgi:hypothetical protein
MPVKSDNTLMPLSFTRTLRLKVRAEAYAWLNAAAVEVNEVFNYCNEDMLGLLQEKFRAPRLRQVEMRYQ